MRHARPALAAIVLVLASIAATVSASEIETLLMPGKVISAHAKLERECAQCHDRADKDRQSSLCLACHKDIAEDVQRKAGFHGRSAGIGRTQCRACHTEHRGRDADIVKLNRLTFDHSRTDFALEGVHARTDCASCHPRGRKFRETASRCADCHRDADPHAASLGTECGGCHDPSGWHRTRFDHDKTRFSLREAHARATCGACHFGNRFKGTPAQCVSCHAPDDVHRGSRGSDCSSCHSSVAWKTTRYDHARETGYALVGRHADLACEACHRTSSLTDPLPRDCAGCHRSDDAHGTRFGTACDKCHEPVKWRRVAFDHVRDGRFELVGAHATLDCHACHTAAIGQQKLGNDCRSCHGTRDIHSGKLGEDCARCHGVESWKKDVAFDHDLTSFPLVGLHIAVPCQQCHVSPSFKGEPVRCVDCHARNDVHREGLGAQCDDCHTPSGWDLWEFDHGKATTFSLTGAHARAACDGCHRKPPSTVKLSNDCAACHTRDDVHLGQFGRQCQRCHGTSTFSGARLQ